MCTSKLSCGLLVTGLVAVASGHTAVAEIRYNVVDLGPVISTGDTGKDINALGVVAFTQSTGVRLYHNGVTTVLEGVAANNGPLAINNFSHLAGAQNRRGYHYADGTKRDLGSLDPIWNDDIYANDLNDLDTVVGVSRIVGENSWRAFSWTNGSMSPLPAPVGQSYGTAVHSSAEAINNAGTILGSFGRGVPQGESPVMWQGGIGRILPMPEGYDYGYAADLNELNRAAGYVRNSTGYTQPAVWGPESVELLGLVAGLPCARASALNDLGQVVGFAGYVGQDRGLGVLWEDGQPTLLNSLVDPSSGWEIWNVSAINGSGMIAGWGQHTVAPGITEVRSVLLTPVPEPAGMLVVASSMMALARRVRRRA